jgi:hypothetical protein
MTRISSHWNRSFSTVATSKVKLKACTADFHISLLEFPTFCLTLAIDSIGVYQVILFIIIFHVSARPCTPRMPDRLQKIPSFADPSSSFIHCTYLLTTSLSFPFCSSFSLIGFSSRDAQRRPQIEQAYQNVPDHFVERTFHDKSREKTQQCHSLPSGWPRPPATLTVCV